MQVLTIDAALGRRSAGIIADKAVLFERREAAERGEPGALAALVESVLAHTGVTIEQLDAVAVTVGPGSFTGLRSAIALAVGLGLGSARPVIGVRVHEALEAAATRRGARGFWSAIDSKRGSVFLDQGAGPAACALDALPRPVSPVAIGGDAAIAVAARLLARGNPAMLTDSRLPTPWAIATVARARLTGMLAPLAAEPLYVDPPEARPPATGQRPPPR